MRKCYIRFGNLPENNFSKNYLTNKFENGVSVYDAIEEDNKYSVIMPHPTYSNCVSLSGVLDRPVMEVDGILVGHGSDNEPLLNNCKIVKNNICLK